MHLININTLEIKEFTGSRPPYAILSHLWVGQEITYQDLAVNCKRYGDGYDKVKAFCDFLQQDDSRRLTRSETFNERVEWAWIDTCCIDKTSSAELSEAINSMANFYSRSEYCVAYLSDVSLPESYSAMKASLKASAWFRRGWTLQELLFPSEVLFCCNSWEVLGQGRPLEKTDALITEITGIPRECLRTPVAARRRSVAQRLSWAASRATTRIEDEAYCLLGLLDVNMPLLYGEGSRAFMRLQEEVIRRSDDETILAWRPPTSAPVPPVAGRFGILAHTHRWFEGCGDLVSQRLNRRRPYQITNRGLEFDASSLKFKLPLPSEPTRKYREIYVIQLNCYSRRGNTKEGQIAYLLALERDNNIYYRVRAGDTTEQLWGSLVRAAARIVTMKPRTFHIATADADTFGELLSSNQNALKVLTLGERWKGMSDRPSPFKMQNVSTHGTSECESDDRSGMGHRYLARSTTEEMALWAERDLEIPLN